MSYKNFEIWQLARALVIEIHKMTLQKLPKFELFEEGSQIRRSSKTVKSAIVEGYGRRQYQQDYLRYLIIALSSNDETTDHLENLSETESLNDKVLYTTLHKRLEILGKKLNLFIQSVEQRQPKEERNSRKKLTSTQQQASRTQHPEPRTQHPEASTQEPRNG